MKEVKFQVFEWLDMNNPDEFIGFGIKIRIDGTWLMCNEGDKHIWATRAEATRVGRALVKDVHIKMQADL